MGHDVYICYDKEEREVSDALYDVFKENNITAWAKSKNFYPGDPVDKITNAIADSKCFILVLSKNSKDANYVITEADIAFSRDVPILVYRIDESKIKGNLEFILETQRLMPSFPNTKKQLENLVMETSSIIGKPIESVKTNSKSVKIIDKYNPQRDQNIIKKGLAIAIPLAIVLILIYFFVIVPTGQNTTESGVFSMNITDVQLSPSAGGYKYTVLGESYNLPNDSENYFMNLKFFDKDDNMVFEVNSTADEFKSGVIWSGDIEEGDISHLGFKLTDMNEKILSQEDYKIE